MGTRWSDSDVLDSVDRGHGLTPAAMTRAFELADRGYIDTSGTWRLTRKGREKLQVERALGEGRARATRVRSTRGRSTRGRSTRRKSCKAGSVPVIFRVWSRSEGGGVIAIFPTLVEGNGQVEMYEHQGGHGSGDLGIIHKTRLATPAEYGPLKRELESAPYFYTLCVVKRASRR